VAAAVAWLEAAFGFRVRLKIGDHRAQLWFESSCLIVGETGKDNQWATRSSTSLRVKDVDALSGHSPRLSRISTPRFGAGKPWNCDLAAR
jgi:hypothetical protein